MCACRPVRRNRYESGVRHAYWHGFRGERHGGGEYGYLRDTTQGGGFKPASPFGAVGYTLSLTVALDGAVGGDWGAPRVGGFSPGGCGVWGVDAGTTARHPQGVGRYRCSRSLAGLLARSQLSGQTSGCAVG